MPFTGTPAAERCEKEVLARYGAGIFRVGQYNRRPIANSDSWSQHSWGNGLDFHVTEVGSANPEQRKVGDAIAAFLRANAQALGVKAVLWWVADHEDHVHVDFWPTGIGTPPVSTTGIGRFKYSTGVTVSRRLQEVPPQGNGIINEAEDDMAILTDAEQRELQAFLAAIKAAGSNVGFVTQCIEDIREKNAAGGVYSPKTHAHPYVKDVTVQK